MTKSRDYKLGYANGYNAGCRRSNSTVERERSRAFQASQRAERAEKQQGLGHCEGCKYWSRGNGAPYAEEYSWGICEAPRLAGTPWGVYVNASMTNQRAAKIQTTPRFGCVMFLSSNSI